ncbi:nucleoid-associated protein YejK [Thaumasiovibrio subtropicus]|uniref:nucleoid-associated protein YejK n=1 Tax=Thaumasiovibrio subtropicus TaxID=1891207 RepID=UPI000B360FC9|nr:nucleoid-associated protein YejK [Thaumasiovibrio subtropicus]
MSLSLSHLILHQIVKNEQDELTLNLRGHSLDNSASSEELVSELHRVFNSKGGKGFAYFDSESDVQQWLADYRGDEINFVEFSNQCAERLKTELSKYPFAEAGTLVLAHYQSLATEYLFVGMLNSQQSMQVTEQLDINNVAYLDVAKMDIAARIDLSTYDTDKESKRYLTFIKGRVGRKVGDFFLDFMQAEEGMDTKQQNQILMQAVEDYCTDARLDKEEKQQTRQQVYDYCNSQLQSGEELTVKELAGELPSAESGGDFYQFAEERGYELEEAFPVDRTAMRKLKKFVGSGGGLSVSFDSLLLGERIFYDQDTDTLTIKGTPPNLKDQLMRRLNSDDE